MTEVDIISDLRILLAIQREAIRQTEELLALLDADEEMTPDEHAEFQLMLAEAGIDARS